MLLVLNDETMDAEMFQRKALELEGIGITDIERTIGAMRFCGHNVTVLKGGINDINNSNEEEYRSLYQEVKRT